MLTRFDPFAEMSRLQDQLFRLNPQPSASTEFAFRPTVDIFEDEASIQLKADLAGVKPEDVHIEVENNVLTVRGERKLEHEEKKKGYHRVERAYGSFSRSFALPDTVDSERIDAAFKDGVLNLTIAKRPAAQKKQIKVKS
jgi:HSP20 family protein